MFVSASWDERAIVEGGSEREVGVRIEGVRKEKKAKGNAEAGIRRI